MKSSRTRTSSTPISVSPTTDRPLPYRPSFFACQEAPKPRPSETPDGHSLPNFRRPLRPDGQAPDLLVQVIWEGFVSGILYALIALGFVLIFKASGIFNFAQGIMVVFARADAGRPA